MNHIGVLSSNMTPQQISELGVSVSGCAELTFFTFLLIHTTPVWLCVCYTPQVVRVCGFPVNRNNSA